tara:strand:- start:7 stop:159 length:153 start_codon:yes stop_codon:yes gene_type:complete
MRKETIFKFIKTPCGQAKYLALNENKSIPGRIRLTWFVVIATLRDLNIKA